MLTHVAIIGALVVAVSACASSPAPVAYTPDAQQSASARDAYVACSTDSLWTIRTDSAKKARAMDVAFVAEQKCANHREALRQALAVDNGDTRGAREFANGYTDTFQERMVASLAEAWMKDQERDSQATR